MKKIIIVNNNMKVGGVQKSLYNLLWTLDDRYDITLLLFRAMGEYMDKLPPGVKVMECNSLFRYLGVSQGESRAKLADTLKRGCLATMCRIFGRPAVMKLLLAGQKQLPETYDCAISYLHNGNVKSFYGGVQDFVLHRVKAKKKIAFLHCDYRNNGADHKENNRSMEMFDWIAACSDGCRSAFEEVLPGLREKCVTVRNCHRFEEIQNLARENTVCYDTGRINAIMVARLAHEKGIERAIKAVAHGIGRGLPITLHIVGSGGMLEQLKDIARELGVEEYIQFYGEQSNPYRFMKNADVFLLTSYHEAAPMVIEEVRCLGLPVLTVRTTSSEEMVTEPGCGWVCENTQEALDSAVFEVLSDTKTLAEVKTRLSRQSMDNTKAIEEFAALIEG